MKRYCLLIVRVILVLVFAGFVAGFAASQYELVRRMVEVVCLSCIGVD